MKTYTVTFTTIVEAETTEEAARIFCERGIGLVIVEDGEAKLIVDADGAEYTVSMNNVSEIYSAADDSTQTEG